jgi:hypothetical protein
MDGIEFFRIGATQLLHACSDYFQAGLFEPAVNFTNDILGHRVRLHDGECSFDSHFSTPYKYMFLISILNYQQLRKFARKIR